MARVLAKKLSEHCFKVYQSLAVGKTQNPASSNGRVGSIPAPATNKIRHKSHFLAFSRDSKVLASGWSSSIHDRCGLRHRLDKRLPVEKTPADTATDHRQRDDDG